MYKCMEFYLTRDLIDFLNENKIPRENVIKIGMIYNVWTLVYYTDETGKANIDDAMAFTSKPLFSDMRTEVEKMFGNIESEE